MHGWSGQPLSHPEDHKAWFRRAGALEGLGRAFSSWSSSLGYLRGSIDDKKLRHDTKDDIKKKDNGQNHIKIYEHIHVFYLIG